MTAPALPAAVERATVHDVDGIHALVNFWAARGDMLPRTKGETYENLRDFFVVREGDEVVACGALHIVWADIAELKSLAVSEERQGQGYGQLLVRACIDEAARLGLDRVFALTYRPQFFERLDFVAGRRDGAAAQGLERVLPLPQVPRLQRDRDDARPALAGCGLMRA